MTVRELYLTLEDILVDHGDLELHYRGYPELSTEMDFDVDEDGTLFFNFYFNSVHSLERSK